MWYPAYSWCATHTGAVGLCTEDKYQTCDVARETKLSKDLRYYLSYLYFSVAYIHVPGALRAKMSRARCMARAGGRVLCMHVGSWAPTCMSVTSPACLAHYTGQNEAAAQAQATASPIVRHACALDQAIYTCVQACKPVFPQASLYMAGMLRRALLQHTPA